MSVTAKTGILVIGYGNTLRGDDGVGPRVAEAVSKLNLPGVRTLICALLTPELADPISRAQKVVFVDAEVVAGYTLQVSGSKCPKRSNLQPSTCNFQPVRWRKLEPKESSQIFGHAADPRTMLAIARDVFGHAPEAWWLTIPAVQMEFSEELTPEARRGFIEAVGKIREFCR